MVGTAAAGGFYVAALVKMGWQQEAEKMLHALAAANRLGVREEWEFNEWLHGETGHPMVCWPNNVIRSGISWSA